MPRTIITQNGHIVQGLPPVADAFAGTVRSDVISMKNHRQCTFVIQKGVGTTGTSTVTVNGCDDTTPTTRTAIPFKYRVNTSGDTWGDVTVATASGFATTAGSNHLYEIIVDGDELGDLGFGYVELNLVEVVDSAVLAGILVILQEPSYAQAIPMTAIT
jgi:hypothetical protein